MYYLILIGVILIAIIIILNIFWRKLSRVGKEKIEDTLKDKQMEVKKKLIESRLEKRILGGGLFLIDKTKSFFKLSLLGVRKIKKRSQRLAEEKNFTGWKKDRLKKQSPLATTNENMLISLIAEAQALLKKRKIDEAEDKFIKALELDPKNIEVYMGLGEIYITRKDLVTAEEAYRYIVKINSKFLEGYKELAKLFELTKRWEDLKKMTEEVLALGHEEAWVYNLLAKSYKKRGYPEEAETYFKKAVELEPQNEEWLDQLIETAILNKNKALAYKGFNTLAQICRDEVKLQSYRDKLDLL